MKNEFDQLNCFINSVIQVLWNVDPLQKSIIAFANDVPNDKKEKMRQNFDVNFRVVEVVQNMFSEIYEHHHLTIQSLEECKSKREEDGTLLVIDTNELRREMFKKFYAKKEEKFGLYEKADASEFFQYLLEMIHYCLNESEEEKKDEDTSCQGKCMIH